MNIIRTPDECFENLPGYHFAANYLDIEGVRMHYVDEGPREGEAVVCLHGEPSWSYLYRKMIPTLSSRYRVLAPDLIGFGKSDKFTKKESYSYAVHAHYLHEFFSQTKLNKVTLVVQDWGGLLGIPYAMRHQDRIERLVIMNTGIVDQAAVKISSPKTLFSAFAFMLWRTFSQLVPDLPVGQIINAGTYPPFSLSQDIIDAYEAPYPDKRYKAGAEIFPSLVPISSSDSGASHMSFAAHELERYDKPVLIMFSDKDPITAMFADYFADKVTRAQRVEIKDAGHFLQEDKGEELAKNILRFMDDN